MTEILTPTIPRSQDPTVLRQHRKILTTLQKLEEELKGLKLHPREYSHIRFGWEAAVIERKANLDTVRELIDYHSAIVVSLNDNQR